MLRHSLLALTISCSLVSGFYVTYAVLNDIAPTLIDADVRSKLSTIRVHVVNR